ncbi:MAG: hypothetical protein V4638_01305 [Bacteroidota bacterium]
MKKIILSTILVLTATFGAKAQLTEGHISYKIEMTADNPEMAMAVGMMQGSTLDTYVSGDKTRTEMKMGTMMTTSTVTDMKTNKGLMLMSGMMGNQAMPMDLEELNKDAEANMPKFEITKTDETKEILGYTCTRIILTMEEGLELNYYVTDKISVNTSGQKMYFEGIEGFPLQFELNNQGLKMVMTTTAIETALSKEQKSTLFDLSIPKGYKEMTMDDLKKMGM